MEQTLPKNTQEQNQNDMVVGLKLQAYNLGQKLVERLPKLANM